MLMRTLGSALLALTLGLPATAEDTGVTYVSGRQAERFAAYEQARDLYARECDVGNTASCLALGHLYRQGRGGPQDYEAAMKLFEQVCEAGMADGCTRAAYHLFEGSLGSEDYPGARSFYEKACDLGDAGGCAGFGNMLYAGLGGPADRFRGEQLMFDACARENEYACDQLKRYGRNRPE